MIFGVYRFLSIAVSTCNAIGNSVATVVIAKWCKELDMLQMERHLYPERFTATAVVDATLHVRATVGQATPTSVED